MNDAEKVSKIRHIIAVMERHQNEDDGGARPFNETGEAMEAIRLVVGGFTDDWIVQQFLEEPV